MKLNEPIAFQPLFAERVWGGRHLESLYGKDLPKGPPIGESWEIVDRESEQSVVASGPLKGRTLHQLWTEDRETIFGNTPSCNPRFPLLFKLLDARDRLSVQVHPPAAVAPKLNGEPKTEMWYFADCDAGSDIFAGLKKGVTREEFAKALDEGTVEEKIHSIRVKAGEAIFIPSGRIHAIGAGNVIVEVQQNSDTTYRVFDWNRAGLDGKPRAMHIAESLASIDFNDFEPELAKQEGELVVECEYFRVEKWRLEAPRRAAGENRFAIFTCLEGEIECGGAQFKPGDFFLVPACATGLELKPVSGAATVLRTTIP
jgi:mannose-6-phosphate isomerase